MSNAFLTAQDIATFEAVLESTLPDTATILTRGQTTTTTGGLDFTYTASATVPCRVDSPRLRSAGHSENELIQAGRITLAQNWMIIVPASTVIGAKDRISTGGSTYEVTLVSGHSWQIGKHLTCVKVGRSS